MIEYALSFMFFLFCFSNVKFDLGSRYMSLFDLLSFVLKERRRIFNIGLYVFCFLRRVVIGKVFLGVEVVFQ